MNIHLKVKICSLAAESRIIRQQEQRLVRQKAGRKPTPDDPAYSPTYSRTLNKVEYDHIKLRTDRKLWKAKSASVKTGLVWLSLHGHRRGVVREESRCSQIAYAFLREKPYALIERKCYLSPDWVRVYDIIKRFSKEKDQRILSQRFEQWKQDGKDSQDILKQLRENPTEDGVQGDLRQAS